MATEEARTRLEGRVEFYRESDGSVTADDSETGRAHGGETRGAALRDLGEVLILLAGVANRSRTKQPRFTKSASTQTRFRMTPSHSPTSCSRRAWSGRYSPVAKSRKY